MGSKLYVGNLAYSTSEEALRLAFAQDGRQVDKVSVITDRGTGRSRGFAFVEMASVEDAKAAMEALDGVELDGRPLRVTEARERDGGRRGPPPRGRNGDRRDGPSRRDDGPPRRADGPPRRADGAGPPRRDDGPPRRDDGPPRRADGPPRRADGAGPPRRDGPPRRADAVDDDGDRGGRELGFAPREFEAPWPDRSERDGNGRGRGRANRRSRDRDRSDHEGEFERPRGRSRGRKGNWKRDWEI